MELFVPSLFTLLLGAVLVLTVIPRITPFFIFIIVVIFFSLSVYSHYLLFKSDYETLVWRDYLANSIPIVFGVIIAIGIVVSTLNLFTNVKITMPVISFSNTKPQAQLKGYSNIPIEKIIELEKQL